MALTLAKEQVVARWYLQPQHWRGACEAATTDGIAQMCRRCTRAEAVATQVARQEKGWRRKGGPAPHRHGCNGAAMVPKQQHPPPFRCCSAQPGRCWTLPGGDGEDRRGGLTAAHKAAMGRSGAVEMSRGGRVDAVVGEMATTARSDGSSSWQQGSWQQGRTEGEDAYSRWRIVICWRATQGRHFEFCVP